jgi:hypothetical protein
MLTLWLRRTLARECLFGVSSPWNRKFFKGAIVAFLLALVPALMVYIVAATTRSTTAFFIAVSVAVVISFVGAPVFFLFDLAAVVISYYAVSKTVKFKSNVKSAVENPLPPAQWGNRQVQSGASQRADKEEHMTEAQRRRENMERLAEKRKAAAQRARDEQNDLPF